MAWDDISDFESPPPRSTRVTVCFLALAIAGTLTAAILHSVAELPYMEWLAFSEPRAIGDLWLWQFVTHVFFPARDLPILSAVLFLLSAGLVWTIGRELEREVGPTRMATILFATAAYGAAAHAIFQTLGGSSASACGPIPAAAAVTVTGALRWPNRTVMFCFLFPMRFATATILGFGIVFFLTFVELRAGHSQLFTLLGASAAAIAVEHATTAIDRRAGEREIRLSRQHFLEEVALRRRADELLEKITRSGLESLTSQERRTLKRASRLIVSQPMGKKEE